MIRVVAKPLGIAFALRIILRRVLNRLVNKISLFLDQKFNRPTIDLLELENSELNDYLFSRVSNYSEYDIGSPNLMDYIKRNTVR